MYAPDPSVPPGWRAPLRVTTDDFSMPPYDRVTNYIVWAHACPPYNEIAISSWSWSMAPDGNSYDVNATLCNPYPQAVNARAVFSGYAADGTLRNMSTMPNMVETYLLAPLECKPISGSTWPIDWYVQTGRLSAHAVPAAGQSVLGAETLEANR